MKLPAMRFDAEALGGFLLRHAEKIVGAIVAVTAALLVWGGIESLRSRSVRVNELPEAIRTEVNRADAHITSVPKPPDDLLPGHAPLVAAVEPWLAAKPEPAPAVTVLDNPLFPEFSPRSQPEVLPVEDLRAVAGIAVLPVAAAAGDAGQPPGRQPPGRQPAAPPSERRDRPGRQRPGEFPDPAGFPNPAAFPNPAGFPGAGGGPPAGLGAGGAEPPQVAPGTPGRIVPYVVVTGLIPAAKQREEYRRRFTAAGYRDARRDAPLWSDFEVERCTIVDGQDGPWRKIDLVESARAQARDWPAAQPVAVPPVYLLQSVEERRSRETPVEFCGALPQRIDRPWAAEPFHPWVLDHIRSQPRPSDTEAGDQPAPGQEPEVPVFGEPGAADPLQGGQPVAGPASPATAGFTPAGSGPMAAGEIEVEKLPDYRLLCFVDTAVKPNTAYRYRIRLKVWNPNLNLPRQHLSDPAIAKEQRLASPASAATPPAVVPDPTRLLVDVFPAAELKKLRIKPGMLEVLVLAASAETGNYALRSALIDVGGFANVDKRLNRPGELRTRGEDVVTDRLLVDVFGQQVEGDDKPRRGPRKIPEPFTAVFMRPDGSFEQVAAADSERLIDRYGETLPERESTRRDSRPPGANPGSDIFSPALGPQSDPFTPSLRK